MGTADVGHWTVRFGNYNLATRLFGKGTLEHGIPSHSLCVSGLVSESDECLPRFLCFGSPTMKSKALLHCNNNPSEASMIGKWFKWLDFSWLQWFCCMESMKRLSWHDSQPSRSLWDLPRARRWEHGWAFHPRRRQWHVKMAVEVKFWVGCGSAPKEYWGPRVVQCSFKHTVYIIVSLQDL